LSPDPLPMDDDEFLEISKIPFSEALEMARRGEMQDGKTIVSLMLAERFLKA
jgi:ADP-ribose pyrophosphatase